LHDDITQRLARLAIDAGGLNSDQQATRSAVARDVREELTRLSEDVHALAYKMHPALLQRLGLATSLRVECERFSQRESIPVCLNLAEIPRQVSQDTALCLVRVMQEALTNVGRHAQAETAAVSLRVAGEGLELTVTDTGIGFKPGMEFRQSLGLASMQERVRLLEGQLTVESKPNKGTMVRAWVPLDENRITT
jgi:signal transduction histidine kinase